STTDRLGRRKDFSYDAGDRLTRETWVSGGSTVETLTFTYDANNNLLTAAKSTGSYTLSYDALDRVKTTQQPFGFGLTFTYDAAGNRTVVQDSFGATVTSVYDAANRLTSRQLGGTGQTPLRVDFSYTARDQVSVVTRYSDLAGTQKVGESGYTYDGVGRLTNLPHKDGSGPTPAQLPLQLRPGQPRHRRDAQRHHHQLRLRRYQRADQPRQQHVQLRPGRQPEHDRLRDRDRQPHDE